MRSKHPIRRPSILSEIVFKFAWPTKYETKILLSDSVMFASHSLRLDVYVSQRSTSFPIQHLVDLPSPASIDWITSVIAGEIARSKFFKKFIGGRYKIKKENHPEYRDFEVPFAPVGQCECVWLKLLFCTSRQEMWSCDTRNLSVVNLRSSRGVDEYRIIIIGLKLLHAFGWSDVYFDF